MQVSPTSALLLPSTLVAPESKAKLTITKDNGTFIAFELNHLLIDSVLNPINFSGVIPHGGVEKGPSSPRGQERVIYSEETT